MFKTCIEIEYKYNSQLSKCFLHFTTWRFSWIKILPCCITLFFFFPLLCTFFDWQAVNLLKSCVENWREIQLILEKKEIMTEVINCGFARVIIWQSKSLALSRLQKRKDESQKSFLNRINNEKFVIYKENFGDLANFTIEKGKKVRSLANTLYSRYQWGTTTLLEWKGIYYVVLSIILIARTKVLMCYISPKYIGLIFQPAALLILIMKLSLFQIN